MLVDLWIVDHWLPIYNKYSSKGSIPLTESAVIMLVRLLSYDIIVCILASVFTQKLLLILEIRLLYRGILEYGG